MGIIDSALIPEWGNQATHVTAIKIPKEEAVKIFSGKSGYQGGFYVGNKSQVIIDGGPKLEWVIERWVFGE